LRAFLEGKSCLLSPGAPDSPVHTGHCPVRISFLLWRSRMLVPGSRWRTGHCPVHTGQSGAPSRSLARPRVLRRSRSRPLARPTVGSPDSSVNYSRTPLIHSREWEVRLSQPGAPDSPMHHQTVRCTQTALTLAELSHPAPIQSFLFPALRHNTLVHKTMY
jgi:hypothetical protein